MTREPTQAPTSTPAWALIHHAANGASYVCASSRPVTVMTDDEGFTTEQLGLTEPPHPGFWLWTGTVEFDGLDDVELVPSGDLELLTYGAAGCRMASHEDSSD